MSIAARAARSWAGGYIVPSVTGTVTATAQDAQGRVQIAVVWSAAQYINVYRILDGVATRVRGASPSPDPSGIQTVYDYEAPLDVPVSYRVTTPWLAFAGLTSNTVTLASSGSSWLSHPGNASLAMSVSILVQPSKTYGIDRGVFLPIGRRYPVVVTGGPRRAAAASLGVFIETLAELTALRAILADGSPILLRTPAGYGWDPLTWMAVGDVDENPWSDKGYNAERLIELPFIQVDAPAVT